jgi:hypothetical protein
MIAALLLLLAQEGTLDVLDGETLYEGGWLLTLSYEYERRDGLREGSDRISDPLDRKIIEQGITLAGHYGLRHNLQLSLILPYRYRTMDLDDPAGPDRFQADGIGDITPIVKWRFQRWDGPGWSLNWAAIAGIELPTGRDDRKDHGVLLPEDLQPGSASWDPFLGTAATYEPGRWRFNAFLLYQINGSGDEYNRGDEFFAEIAVGNRFWLEPYPGPFMRFDAMIRYRHEARGSDRDSGGDVVTLGANLAFRPQPSLDFQLAVELPILQNLNGVQVEEGWSTVFSFGLRF